MTFHFKRSRGINVRKTAIALRVLFILFLILAISPLACTPAANTPVPTDTAATAPATPATPAGDTSALTFIAEADAQVNEENPGDNAGTSKFLQVDGDSEAEVESFVRFTVTGISGAIQSARLRLYDVTNASENGPAVYATGTYWSEAEITWDLRPERTNEELDNQGSIATETWVEYDVTQAVTGDGTFSFVLAADSGDAATFSSRQGSQPPELVITLAGGSAPTPEAATATAIPALGNTNQQSTGRERTYSFRCRGGPRASGNRSPQRILEMAPPYARMAPLTRALKVFCASP